MDRDQQAHIQQEEPQGLEVPKKKKGFLSGLLRRASLASGKKPLLKKVGARSRD